MTSSDSVDCSTATTHPTKRPTAVTTGKKRGRPAKAIVAADHSTNHCHCSLDMITQSPPVIEKVSSTPQMLHEEDLSVEQQLTQLSFLSNHIFGQDVEDLEQREIAIAEKETDDERRYLEECSYVSDDDYDEDALDLEEEEDNTF